MKKSFTHLLLAGILIFSACKKDILTATEPTPAPAANVPDVPLIPGFNYNTTRDVQLNITLHTNDDSPLADVVVSIYLPGTTEAIFEGVTNNNGVLQGRVTLAGSVNKIIIDPAYVGLMRNAQAIISADNTVNALIGGPKGYGGNIVAEEVLVQKVSSSYQTYGLLATSYVFPYIGNTSTAYTASNAYENTATYPTALGRPKWLESSSDVISASLLSYINASLPEGKPMTATHPNYLSTTAVSTLNIKTTTDVYVTFVSEGANNTNTLAYYTYPTSTPPTSGESLLSGVLGSIDKITYIFPNASAAGSGGGLKSGDKVKLGNFAAGTSIGFILIQNGWSNGAVSPIGKGKFYSADSYNANKMKQAVLLYDDINKKFVSGFEDIDRSVIGNTDNDFNDLVFYSSSSVAGAISTSNVVTIDHNIDSDGDGVQDSQDAFPNDATRAIVSYYPSASSAGTLAFEDNWPQVGDYDMNDMVVSYRYTYECNAQNKVVDIKADYSVLAAGSIYKHGFGVELPVAASAVSSVTGQKFSKNYITQASNGVEAGQDKAVIIPFDSFDAMFPQAPNATLINTSNNNSKLTSLTASLVITFTTPIDLSTFVASAFNPFMIGRLERGREIHLMGYHPTNKANSKLFDTEDDATVPSKNQYYQSITGEPFAIMFSDKFNYPTEMSNISTAYKEYNAWATSSGKTYADWYSNLAAGYRNPACIYTK